MMASWRDGPPPTPLLKLYLKYLGSVYTDYGKVREGETRIQNPTTRMNSKAQVINIITSLEQ